MGTKIKEGGEVLYFEGYECGVESGGGEGLQFVEGRGGKRQLKGEGEIRHLNGGGGVWVLRAGMCTVVCECVLDRPIKRAPPR